MVRVKKTIISSLAIILCGLLFTSVISFAQGVTVGTIEKFKIVPSAEVLGKVYLMWQQEENVFYYNVYRDGKVVGRARDPFYVDKKAIPGAKTVYKIAATKGGKEGATSAEVTIALPTKITLPKKNIEFRGDDIYINGEKYVVCGIGYAPYRPHTSPNKPYPRDYNLVEQDMQILKKAGFNTLRTWSGRDLDEYMMELAHNYGFMILQGMSIWVPPLADFGDKSFQENAFNNVEDEMKANREHNNILGYLIMNEPPPGKISAGGLTNTNDFYARVTDRIKELQPGALVSLANWPRSDMLDTSKWDFISINHYHYDKSHVVVMGYRGYLGWMKRTLAKNKPLIGTEYGYSLSQRGEGHFGYGGNTEDEQAVGIVNDTYDLLAEKGNGACIFSCIDEWWKNNEGVGDEDRHEVTEPEEWFGIIAITDDKNPEGQPRKAFREMGKFYEAVVINPRNANKVQGIVPLEVYSKTAILSDITKMEYSLDGENWQELTQTGNWFKGEFDSKTLTDGKYDLKVRFLLQDGKQVNVEQPVTVHVVNNTTVKQQKLVITTDKQYYKNGDTVNISIKYDEAGKPVSNAKIQYSVVQIGTITASCRILSTGELTSDSKGVARVTYNIKDEERPHFLTIAASVPSEQEVGERFSERIVVEANRVPNLQ